MKHLQETETSPFAYDVAFSIQCNFPAKRVRREATEWSDQDSWLLV